MFKCPESLPRLSKRNARSMIAVSLEILDQHCVKRFRAAGEGQAAIGGPVEPENLVRGEMRHRLRRAARHRAPSVRESGKSSCPLRGLPIEGVDFLGACVASQEK